MPTRRSGTDKLEALQKLPLLHGIGQSALQVLADRINDHRVKAGEWLFRAGSSAASLFIVVSGRLVVVDEQRDVILREVGAGQWTGELGVISGEPRSAGIRAVRDSHLWAISASSFNDLLDEHPEVQRHLLGTLAHMVRSRPIEDARRLGMIAVVGTEAPSLVGEIVSALADALARFGKVGVITPGSAELRPDASRQEMGSIFGHRLDQAEAANDWVLLMADGESGETWRSYVLDQVDRVVAIVDREFPDHWRFPIRPRSRELVITRLDPSPEWWTELDPTSHHFVGGRPTKESLAALARRLAGRSLGMVMAGGGARGIAHFGVYQELVNAGVTLDRFGGTSAGAMAAGGFAMGLPPSEAINKARKLLTAGILSDYTLPATSLVRGDRVEHAGRRFYGSRLIEEIPKGFFSVSADLITGEQVVHRRGSLWRAVRASVSIPGLLPPIRDGERVLVDGGILNNLPADVMAADPDGPIVCVELRGGLSPSRGYGLLPVQPPALVRRLISGTDEEVPAIQDTLLRSLDLASSRSSRSDVGRIAAVIRPDVSRIGLLNFRQFDAAVEAGRTAARATLEQHPELVG